MVLVLCVWVVWMMLMLLLLEVLLLALTISWSSGFFTIAVHVWFILGLRGLFPLALAATVFAGMLHAVLNIHERCAALCLFYAN